MLSRQVQSSILQRVLQRYDPSFHSTIYTSSHVALYKYTTKWDRTSTEGNIIIYRRTTLPSTKLVIFNKKDRGVFEVYLGGIEVDMVRDIIVFKNEAFCYGIWMVVEREREVLVEVVKRIEERMEKSRKLLDKIRE
ncbi:hypothetical protein VCUG_02041 [Vavraia culicis subsp. floridensis]|uniref:mRNA-decapping enzyme C-terminal domain-containing protein n=1 Tax=Vavraia culicis (isolate floridensis) TaxID=948595 RepID=L2GS13_VAVCU|nr:uncharacterized protein VCUG_02041 [Vavraia culicis subsp. floridensis]ELA46446.1 hypothetical protein VCUG_02041 [Vavraia culicis subsp. floridensis]